MQKLRVIAKKWFQVRKSDWFYFIIVDGSKKHREKDGYDAEFHWTIPALVHPRLLLVNYCYYRWIVIKA